MSERMRMHAATINKVDMEISDILFKAAEGDKPNVKALVLKAFQKRFGSYRSCAILPIRQFVKFSAPK